MLAKAHQEPENGAVEAGTLYSPSGNCWPDCLHDAGPHWLEIVLNAFRRETYLHLSSRGAVWQGLKAFFEGMTYI
jgi:hypothetical protein